MMTHTHTHTRACYLCGATNTTRLQGQCRDDASIYPLKCRHCGLVFLSRFPSGREENYYENSRMHDDNTHLDTKVVDAVAEADVARRLDLLKNRGTGKDFLDFGCGDGRLLENIRPFFQSVSGVEPERCMQQRLQQMNVPVYPLAKNIPEQSKFNCISLFHVLEHLPDPLTELQTLVSHMQPGGKMFIEVPNADDALLTRYSVEAFAGFTYWSCHLYLFTSATLRRLLEKMAFSHINIWQIQRYGLPNHMGWIAEGKPTGLSGGDNFSWLCDEKLTKAYEQHLAACNCADTIVAECIL